MSKTETGLWVIVFFIAIVFFILICQSSKKSVYGQGRGDFNDAEDFEWPIDQTERNKLEAERRDAEIRRSIWWLSEV